MHILFELCFPIPQSVKATIRTIRTIRYSRLFAVRCSLFAIRDYSLFAIRYSGFPDTPAGGLTLLEIPDYSNDVERMTALQV